MTLEEFVNYVTGKGASTKSDIYIREEKLQNYLYLLKNHIDVRNGEIFITIPQKEQPTNPFDKIIQ